MSATIRTGSTRHGHLKDTEVRIESSLASALNSTTVLLFVMLLIIVLGILLAPR